MSKQKHGRMDVKRIETNGYGRVEPRFNEEWTPFDKLRWEAGVVHADTGLDITVKPSDYSVNGVPQEGYTNIRIAGSAVIGPCTFDTASDIMHGITVGYQAAKREDQ